MGTRFTAATNLRRKSLSRLGRSELRSLQREIDISDASSDLGDFNTYRYTRSMVRRRMIDHALLAPSIKHFTD